MNTNNKWYAIQRTSADSWDNGTFDYDEAEEMLRKQGGGLIAVIENDFCTEEIPYDDIWGRLDYLLPESLAAVVRFEETWDSERTQEAMYELCEWAYSEFDGVENKKSIACDILNKLHKEGTDDIRKYSEQDITDDLIKEAKDILEDYDEISCEDPCDIARIFQIILDIDLGI